MTPRSIQYILRSLAETGPPISDADLLRDFLRKDEAAFAELVRRHGRLVWAVCRHLTRSDAEADDAFQATFLVLLQNAKKVREAGKLSAWLHGVAYKVCAKARRSAQRREAREQRTAAREGDGSAVPDSAWDRALAAVHEEVAKLPETQRVPFVLCCLEGIGVTEAAERLGWKLGTLSGRLTRAKDAVLLRLEARGLTLGVVASAGVVTVPTAVAAKAEALAQVGFAVPSSILQLSQGVIGMNVKSVKALAAAVMVATGFGLSVGGGWSGEAVAQVSGLPPAKVAPVDPKLDKLKADLEKAKAELAKAEAEVDAKVRENFQQRLLLAWGAAREAPKYEYEPVPERGLQVGLFEKMLTEREKNGWEFLGQVTLLKATVEGREAKLVFRKKPPVDARALWVLPQNAPLPPGGIMPPAPKVVKPSDPDAPPAFAPVRPGAALPTPTVVPGGPILPLPMPGSPPPPGSAGARPNANGGLGERLARFENAVLEKFQGSWRLTGWELAGGKLTAEEMKARDDVMVIEGNNFTYLDKGQKVYFGRIAVDSTQDPPTLLLLGTDRKQDMYTWCIYELDGDTLRICKDVKGKGRPTEFKASENTVIQSYRRTK